ncbi:MAG: hypothetical protein LBC67_06855 [Spirochaetales bacterium]|nr:hypothetical protein [Spirochaetales bacterium]
MTLRVKKPGYPLQVLESANALSAGFPLLSLALHNFAPQNCAGPAAFALRSILFCIVAANAAALRNSRKILYASPNNQKKSSFFLLNKSIVSPLSYRIFFNTEELIIYYNIVNYAPPKMRFFAFTNFAAEESACFSVLPTIL